MMDFKLLVSLAVLSFAGAAYALERIAPCADTCFLLEAKDGAFVDVAGRYRDGEVSVENGTFVQDGEFGEILRFGDRPGSVSVPDGGRISLRDGFSAEAWVRFNEPVKDKGFGFAAKPHAAWDKVPFELVFTGGNKLKLGHLCFNGEPIEWAEYEGMHKWKFHPDATYPSRGNTMNGLYSMPTGRWMHVAFTYDRPRRLLRTWINHGADRQAFNPRYDLFDELVDVDEAPVVLFGGARGLDVAQVHFASKAVVKGCVPPVEVFVSELPYRGGCYARIVPTDNDLPLPLDISIQNLKPPYISPEAHYVLDSLEPRNFDIPRYEFSNAETEVVIRFSKDGREIYKYETMVANASAESPKSWKALRTGVWDKVLPKHPDWWIDGDNTVLYRGKPVFPLMTVFVSTNDFEKAVDLGFTVISVRRPPTLNGGAWSRVLRPYFDRAAERGVTITVGRDEEDRPAEGFLYAFDEPWGYSFEPMRRRYQQLRSARSHSAELPINGGQNNWQRYRETGMVTDILSVDPYWRGRGPMRNIYDSVRAARREVDDLKPVFLDVASYGPRSARPEYEELRTMCYLGIAAGARGLYFYSWDEGGDTNTADMPDVCEMYRRLFAEFRSLDAALTVPNLGPDPVFEPSARGFFACVKKTRDKKAPKYYLVVASDLYKPAEKTVLIPSLAGRTARLLVGSQYGETTGELKFDAEGRARLVLPPISAAVYEFE